MEMKKRNVDEQIDLRNVCVGIKVDNLNSGVLNIGFRTFTVLEKTDYHIGIIEKEPFTIYKDMEEERYSYVGPDGKVFVPKSNVPYTPSSHLSSVTDVRSYSEIINKFLEICSSQQLDDNSKRIVAYFQAIKNSIDEANKKGLKPTVRLGDIQEQFDQNIHLYIMAFGNPIESGDEKEILSREMTEEELTEKDFQEEKAQEARSKFRLVNSEDEPISKK